jgi:hypothetical protein
MTRLAVIYVAVYNNQRLRNIITSLRTDLQKDELFYSGEFENTGIVVYLADINIAVGIHADIMAGLEFTLPLALSAFKHRDHLAF